MPKSYTQAELIQCVNVLKLTIPRMNNLSIPITPNNYSVWYEYSQGNNLALNRVIDNYLNDATEFSEEINHQLYHDFIAQKPATELKVIQQQTKVLLENLVDKMQKLSTGSNHFEDTLTNCQQLLNGEPDIDKLTQIVSRVLDETQLVNQSNKEMLNNLKIMENEVLSLKQGVESLTESVFTDQLTNIANRRAFESKLDTAFNEFTNNETTFSLLLLDIDHFKQFNDNHGHAVGDKVLVFVAQILHSGVKSFGLAARYGGEEFVVLLPGIDVDKAYKIAEILRKKIAAQRLSADNKTIKIGRITASFGVSGIRQDDTPQSLIERADQAMYQAKSQGRNRVCGVSS